MANNITVNTGTVKSKAGELRNLNKTFKSKVEQLKSTESSLNSMWEGLRQSSIMHLIKISRR